MIATLAAVLIFSLCNVSAAGDCGANITDAIELIQGRAPCGQGDCPCCPELSDVNGDGKINELDGIYLLQHLFNHVQLPDVQPSQDVHLTLEMYSALS